MAETKVTLSKIELVTCAHCGRLMYDSGYIGPWLIRPCPRRDCRDANDGSWCLIFALGAYSVSIAVNKRLAHALGRYMADGIGADPKVMAAAGEFWGGPSTE